MEEIQLENAILEELATKSDDELAAIMGQIQGHPFFPKFADAQRKETGLDDEWSFDVVEQNSHVGDLDVKARSKGTTCPDK